MFGLSQHPFSRVCQHSNPASVTSHRSWSIPVSTQSDFAVFPHENVCQPSSLQSKLRSIKTLLSWLQTVIDGQKSRRNMDKMSKLHRSRLDTSLCTRRSGSSQLASDETLSRTACTGAELHCKPTRSVDQLCEMCPSSTLHSSSHCSNDVSVDSVIGFSAGGSEANVTFERQRLHGEGGKGHDCRGRGTEASTEETDTTNDDRVQHHVQFRSGIQCDDQLGNSSAQRHFDTTITSSVAPICCGHPPEGKDESQTGKCSDDGRRPVKTLSGRLARKLQRSASLVNAGLSKQIQTVLDASTVDRCDFVEICEDVRGDREAQPLQSDQQVTLRNARIPSYRLMSARNASSFMPPRSLAGASHCVHRNVHNRSLRTLMHHEARDCRPITEY